MYNLIVATIINSRFKNTIYKVYKFNNKRERKNEDNNR